MAHIELLAPIILKWEGGFVNHPNDRGGATNKGVTIGTYERYRQLKNLPRPTVDDLKKLSREEWVDILKSMYWDRWRADDITNQPIANLLVDWTWGSGTVGIKYPQQVLGVKADGVVGAITLSAVNNHEDKAELFARLWQRRRKHFESLAQNDATQRVFLRGWLNRLNDFKYYE